MIILEDIQRQLEELHVKFKWQEDNKEFNLLEKISILEELIKTLPENEVLPYKKLLKAYKRFLQIL